MHPAYLMLSVILLGIACCAAAAAGPADLSCEVSSSRELSLRHVALTAAGVLLYFNAPGLSMSPTFRLTSGSLAFMSGGLVVLSIILMR